MSGHTAAVLAGDVLLIAVVAAMMGAVCRRLGQPAVIGEIVGGILLGPTLLGHLSTTLFPHEVRRPLADLANLGVCVFMFLVGLELDRGLVRGQSRTAASVALGSIAVPFGLGVLLALYLVDRHPTAQRTAFVLFIGTAMSITAFPVLARILTDRELIRTPIGSLALACAAVGDVLAWILLAVSVALARSGGHPLRILLVLPYLAVVFGVLGPLAARLAGRGAAADSRGGRSGRGGSDIAGGQGRPRSRGSPRARSGRAVSTAALVLLLALGLAASAIATDRMGLHLIFGAFLFGAVLPRHGAESLRTKLQPWVERIGTAVLLPIFFMVAGLGVDLSKAGLAGAGELALILLVAIGGKLAGAFGGARTLGIGPRPAAALAVLLNTRGLTELIVLAVGVQTHILDPRLNSLMVVMAVVTTTMTGILLGRVYPAEQMRLDAARSVRDAVPISPVSSLSPVSPARPEPKELRP